MRPGRFIWPPDMPPSSKYSRDNNPAFGLLAYDIGLARLTLSIQAVEVLFKPFLARLARIDRATDLPLRRQDAALRVGRSGLCSSPKNLGPDHRVPVIVRATSDRLLKRRPS